MIYHPLISLLYLNKYVNIAPRQFRNTVTFARHLIVLILCGIIAYNLPDLDLAVALVILIVCSVVLKFFDYLTSY